MASTVIPRFILLQWKRSINFSACRKFSTVLQSHNHKVLKCEFTERFHSKYFHSNILRANDNGINVLADKVTNVKPDKNFALQFKKRPKKRPASKNEHTPGMWNVIALTTAEEYDLESLTADISKQNLYIPNSICTSTSSLPDVIHAVAKYEVELEPREVFFFREGTVVMWNISDLEHGNILKFLRSYEQNPYSERIIHSESELMKYTYADSGKQSHIKDGTFLLATGATNLDKYTFSNAMAQSVKLGAWEASLDDYVDSIEFVTDDLKLGRKLRITQQEVLKKQGELFALRHSINLSSDLLDTPDFYWERDDLEILYHQTCSYFNIARRTRVINEKINHCVELVGILSSHLSDRHHIRLEWMIIILIMVEVAFEMLHYLNRYFI